MCGQVVCMQGTVRLGGGAFSPLPSATRSRCAVFFISLPHEGAQDGPADEARLMHQPSRPRGTEDGEPQVRPQLALPIELPVHAGTEEIEFGQAAGTGVADRLRDHLLARRVFVERLVVAELDQVVALLVHQAEVRGDRLALKREGAEGESAAPRGIARDLRVEADQLRALRDGGAVLALPAAGLDLVEVGQGRIERARVLRVRERVLHLALLGEATPAAAKVLAELAVDRLLPLLRAPPKGQAGGAPGD